MRRATVRSMGVLAAVLSVTAWLAAAPATSQATDVKHDRASVAGYDYHTLHPADVIAGSTGNNLAIHYTAGRAVTDGVLRIAIPTRAWPTPVHPVGPLYPGAAPGGFSVRPGLTDEGATLPDPTAPAGSACEAVAAGSWDVSSVPGAQLITVHGVTCAAGSSLAILIEGIQAPSAPRTYRFPVLATSASSHPRLSVATARVVRPPTTRLVVTTPSTVPAGSPFIITVTALLPNGTPDTGYSGAVALVAEDAPDCTLTPRDQSVAYQFTPADQGTALIAVELDQMVATRLRAYDVGHGAQDGVSAPFVVAGPPPGAVTCPVSFH